MIEEKESNKRKDSKPKLDAEMMDLINKAADSHREDEAGREDRNKHCDRGGDVSSDEEGT
ncbi:MAG: hypothetical protein QXU32_09985 [Nitrososphaerales archaeon]